MDDQATNPEDLQRAEKAGKVQAREILGSTLLALGPRRGQTVTALEAEVETICTRLAYMTPRGLQAVRDAAFALAGRMLKGPGRAPACPPMEQVQALAFGFEFPPPRETAFYVSLLQSRLGALARDEGWHVQLYQHARRNGPPLPGPFTIDQLKEKAAEDERQLTRIRRKCDEGSDTMADREFLARWHNAKAAADALVDQGAVARAASGTAQGEVAA